MAVPVRFTMPARAVLKSTDAKKRTATAVLTYPQVDSDGDFVEPRGGDWTRGPWSNNPVVDWGHYVPIGRGAVTLKSITDAETPFVGPVGTTTFFQREADTEGLTLLGRNARGQFHRYSPAECVDAAGQGWELIEQGIAQGVSIEFEPVPGAYEVIGKARHQGGRPPRHYRLWTPRRYCHTRTPVNDRAKVTEVALKANDILARGTLGGIALHEVILKGLEPYRDLLPRRTSVRVVKAMDEYDDDPDNPAPAPAPEPAPDAVPDDMPPEEPAPDTASDLPPEATDAHDGSQVLTDLAARYRERAGKTLHGASRKFYAKLADMLEKAASMSAEHGESVESEISGNAPDEGGDEEDADEESDEDESAEKGRDWLPLVTDDDGRVLTKSGYVPRRAVVVTKSKPEPQPDPAAEAELEREFALLDRARRRAQHINRLRTRSGAPR